MSGFVVKNFAKFTIFVIKLVNCLIVKTNLEYVTEVW